MNDQFKVSPKFKQLLDEYFECIPEYSFRATIKNHIEKGLPVSIYTVNGAIQELENAISDVMFEELKDGEKNPKKPRKLVSMIRLLKKSMQKNTTGEIIPIDLPETASFKEFKDLKVPGGRDQFSSLRLPNLIGILDDSASLISQIEEIWRQQNILKDDQDYNDKELTKVLRWHLRGLSLGAAVKKVRVDNSVLNRHGRS